MENEKMKVLEEINKEYKASLLEKQKLEKCKDAIKKLSQELDIANNKVSIFEVEKKNAIIVKDKVAEKDAQSKIDAEKKKIELLKESLKKIQSIVVNNQNKIDTQMQKISSNPEVKKVLDAAISKTVLRKNQRLLKENEQLELIKALLEKHPSITKQIVGMKNAEVAIKKLEDDKSKLDPIKDKATIDKINDDIKTAKVKYENNKNIIMKLAQKDNIELEENMLNDFISGNFKVNKGTGEYNIESTLNNRINGNLKSIKNNEIVLSKIDGRDIKTVLRDDDHTMEVEAKNTRKNLPALSKKTKWWQFKTRFKNWRENRKAAKLEKEPPELYNRADYEKETEKNSNNEFRNAYKLEVIKDYAKQREQELYKEAIKSQKDAKQKDNEGR